MEDKIVSKYLSETERKRFDALAKFSTAKEAAISLGISESTLNNWTFKLRKRLLQERGHLNACLSQTKRAPLIKKVLSTKKPIKPAKPQEEENYFE